ncbi:MAG TPA: membrane protein insertion efficiency factor YidD [Candidatus Binatia bacterium]
MMRRILSFLLLSYHQFLSPLMPAACRFYPTCSVYTSRAVLKHGIVKGLALSLRRLSRCHPWNVGGYDPVD